MSRCIPIVLATLLLVSACGQRGELYIPERDRAVVGSVPVGPAATPAPAASEEDEDTTAPPPTGPVPGR